MVLAVLQSLRFQYSHVKGIVTCRFWNYKRFMGVQLSTGVLVDFVVKLMAEQA
jgi:hypothetical protein